MPGEQAKMFSIPQEDVLVIPINHPRYEWFAQFDLQWFAIPLVSNISNIHYIPLTSLPSSFL